MTAHGREEYAAALRPRYALATRQERSRLLDEFCRTTRCHRKAAIRCLRRGARAARGRRGRPGRYGPALLPVLEQLWVASDQLCGKLLRPVLPTLLAALDTHHGVRVPAEIRTALLAASPATLDRLLRPVRRRRGRQPRRVASAVTALKSQIPIRTWGDWSGVAPGALQGDLVLHCGESTEGFYLTTLVAVDVASSWISLRIVWGLSDMRVGGALERLRRALPFVLRDWHTDNGSEFINVAALAWCRRTGIRFTRGRPYKKNDPAWVEQRNWLAVRRLVGHDRYASRAAFAVFERLYRLLALQLNFFRPVRKLIRKQRVGSRVVKHYDAPQTPYQRLLASGVLSPDQREPLDRQLQSLDPIALAHDIRDTLDTLWKLADTRRTSRPEVAHG